MQATNSQSDPNYTFDFSAFQAAAGTGGQGASMAFIGGSASPASAPAANAPAASAPGAAAGPGAGVNPATLLAQSPFAPLLSVPGVTAESLLASLSPNGSGGGVDPLAALGSSANPFDGLVGANNPFAGLTPGGANPFDSLVGAGSPFASSGSNPFAAAA